MQSTSKRIYFKLTLIYVILVHRYLLLQSSVKARIILKDLFFGHIVRLL